MLLRTFSATLQLNQNLELYVTTYWDAATHPAEPTGANLGFGRQQMPIAVNAALDRWKKVAQLGGARFTLEGMLERLIKDDELGAVRIVVQDSNGQGAEVFHNEKWTKFLGVTGPQV